MGADQRVIWFCCVCAALLGGFYLGQYLSEKTRLDKTCQATLSDGRKLSAYHIGMNGQERCTYVAPSWGKWRKG